jgi:hypothetical protein
MEKLMRSKYSKLIIDYGIATVNKQAISIPYFRRSNLL